MTPLFLVTNTCGIFKQLLSFSPCGPLPSQKYREIGGLAAHLLIRFHLISSQLCQLLLKPGRLGGIWANRIIYIMKIPTTVTFINDSTFLQAFNWVIISCYSNLWYLNNCRVPGWGVGPQPLMQFSIPKEND